MEHTQTNHADVTSPAHPVAGREEIVTNMDRRPQLSWGAVVSGLMVVIAVSWLLNLLGVALGASIADASDGDAVGQGLGIGAVVWIILSALIAYFLGSLMTARLSGTLDNTAGMLHGLTLWATATTLVLILAYFGVSSLLQTGFQLAKTTATVVTSAGSQVASGVAAAGQMAADAANSSLGTNIQARLKRRAASVVARSEAAGGADVTPEEVRQAIESIDSQTLEQIVTHITLGETTAAGEALKEQTGLSDREAREIVEGIANDFEQRLGTADDDTGLMGDLSNAVKRQTADFVADLDARGGAEVTQQNVRQALEHLEPETLRMVSVRLLNGDTQGAKDVLAANTNLTTKQISDVVEGVNADVSRRVERYREQAAQAVEAASTYTQAVLWAVFIAAAMGLAVSLLGGWLGAESSRRIELEVRHEGV